MSPPLHALTSLRFFAAAMVFFSHLGFTAQSDSETISWIYTRFFSQGYIGVTFFFILSGFILSYSYNEKSKQNRIDFIDFMSARIARLYPLHILTLLLAVPISLLVTLKMTPLSNIMDTFLLNFSLTQALYSSQETYFSFNAPSWSLSVEMLFYLCFPLLVRLRSTILVLVAIMILLLKYLTDREMGSTPIHYIMYISPTLRLPDFIVGLLLFRLFDSSGKLGAVPATTMQFTSLIVLALAFYFGGFAEQKYRYDAYYIIPMGFIVWAFAYQCGILAQMLSNKILVLLGEASFALYLTHQLIIRYGELIRVEFLEMAGPANEVFFIICYAVLSVAFSYFLFTKFEMQAKANTLAFLRSIRNVKTKIAPYQLSLAETPTKT